jgi:NAD(P)H-hydrate repair Nnr-like enzyme with NAD(P)H-hydrate epimerase domain
MPHDVIFGAAMGIAAQRTVTLHSGRYGMTLAATGGRGSDGLIVAARLRNE